MTYTFDPILVFISILVAIAGAYACFDLIIRVQRSSEPRRKNWLALAALAIGGSIWAMHFIAMLAVRLPAGTHMQYDILVTLVSGLVSIFMTAVALAIVSSGAITPKRIIVSGTAMGLGITTMHYVGMSGMRGNFSLSYDAGWLIISALIGVFASTLSLWLVMGLQLRGVLRRLLSAMVMGFSIAGVHYAGMHGTSFEPIAQLAKVTQPFLSPFSLGLITALVTFAILGWSLLMLLPNNVDQSPYPNVADANSNDNNDSSSSSKGRQGVLADSVTPTPVIKKAAPASQPLLNTTEMQSNDAIAIAETDSSELILPAATPTADVTAERIPVQRNKKTYFLDAREVASISADGHYTTVRTCEGQSYFCNIGFNKLLDDIQLPGFIRVHRSHAINIEHVVSFQRKRDTALVNLGTDEHEVPVSRTNISKIQGALGLVR